jgi:hypothetical protein
VYVGREREEEGRNGGDGIGGGGEEDKIEGNTGHEMEKGRDGE